MAVTWAYNGSNQLQATINPAVIGHRYDLFAFDPDSTSVHATAGSTTLVLTITTIGGIAAGDEFGAKVESFADNSVTGNNIFAYGSASTTGVGFPVTWAYDGALAITVSGFTTSVADGYVLTAEYFDDDVGDFNGVQTMFTGGPGTLTATVTLVDTPHAGSGISVFLRDTEDPNWFAVASRMFVQGVADTGAPGSPTTGGTDTGQPGPTTPTIVATPTGAVAGATVSVDGTNFDASSVLAATLDGVAVALTGTTSTDGAGAFTGALFAVPTLVPATYLLEFST